MGLPPSNRLRKRQDFRRVYQHGICLHSSHLILRALASSQLSSPLIGISISQKVSKKAVIRNRLKRQIRGVFRDLLPLLSPDWKIVVVVKPKAIECRYEDFLRELKQLLVKAKIINGY
ncbi:MAG: ribonuclease P protein component [Cyanophyceae cyanobacterium]